MTIQRIEPGVRLSKALVANGVVHVSGLTALRKDGDIAAETRDVLAQIDHYLQAAGTDRSRLLKVNIWLADIADFDAMDAVWQAWIAPGQPPARATVQAGLRLQARVEIMAEALA